jgi:hypothetical protein
MTQVKPLLLLATFALSGCAQKRDVELAGTTRLVSTPTSIVALTPASHSPALPADINFGGSRGRSALYLKFPADFASYGTAQKAFITLSPRADAAVDATPVAVEAWRVNADWEAADLSTWSDKPPLAPPYSSAEVTAAPARDLRIDVTELVRFAVQNPDLNFGFALLGRGGTGHGASFDTGISAGNAPRLEVYVR